MKREMFESCLVLGCLCLAPLSVMAQEMVHALTVSAIDASGKMITINQTMAPKAFSKTLPMARVKASPDGGDCPLHQCL